MSIPDLARPGRFKPGDKVPLAAGPRDDAAAPAIQALRDLGPDRQQLYFADGKGGLASMVVEINGQGAKVLCESVPAGDALLLAELIAAGKPPRMPLTQQLNILAGALLAADAAAALKNGGSS